MMHSFQTVEAPRARSLFLGLLLVSLLASPAHLFSQGRAVSATIDTSKTGPPISKYIYGQFLEHGGDIVNTGVWSEMLVDRKFFYPVAATAPTPPPVMGNAAGTRASAVLRLAGGLPLAETMLSPWTPNRPSPANSRRSSSSTLRSLTA